MLKKDELILNAIASLVMSILMVLITHKMLSIVSVFIISFITFNILINGIFIVGDLIVKVLPKKQTITQ